MNLQKHCEGGRQKKTEWERKRTDLFTYFNREKAMKISLWKIIVEQIIIETPVVCLHFAIDCKWLLVGAYDFEYILDVGW